MDLTNPTALDYLPSGIAGKPLYRFLGPLVDWALTPSEGINTPALDPLVQPLILDYQDPEAVNAYLNMLVHPISGTRRSMDYAFQLLGISPALVEWWQPALRSPYDSVDPTGQSDKPYHFTVTFPNGTLPKGPFSYHDLIRMLLALKNERSRLVSVRMADCVDMLTLDNDCVLDMYWLDSLEGFADPETGVNICLHDEIRQAVDNSERVAGALFTSQYAQSTHAFPIGLLDFTILGEDTIFDQGTFVVNVSRTSDRAARAVYTLVNVDPARGVYLTPQGRTSDYVGVAGGSDVATHSHGSRTADRAAVYTTALTPTPRQTIPMRSMTQRVPPTAFYTQRAWNDTPDGTGSAWRDLPMTWLSDQPGGYQTHTQQIVSGWTLGPATATLSRPSASGTLYYGTLGQGAVTLGRPVETAAGKAPPAGPVAATLGRPVASSAGRVGVKAIGALSLARPQLSGRGLLVPNAFGLVSMPAPTIDVEATTAPAT